MIETILDKYYNKKFKDILIKDTLSSYVLDFKIEESKDGINILYMKPLKYKNYTKIYQWDRKNSLNLLINMVDVKKIIFKIIDEVDKNKSWN